VPFGYVSSGCIYSGAKIAVAGTTRVEKDLMRPELQAARSMPGAIRGYTEADLPNFSFRSPPCSLYSGAKALAEEAIGHLGGGYLWRLRLPFDEVDHPRNFLTKVQRYPKVYDNLNSLSHLDDFVRAALDLWEMRAPFGTYNITNPGYVTTRQVVAMIKRIRGTRREFHFWANDEEFYRDGAKTPRSNCVLDVSKLLATGVQIRPVEEALEDALSHWRPEEVAEPVASWASGG
jgi:nucleoside-diphosphate-sugar epimerase